MPNMLLKELAKGPPEKLSVEESYTNTFLEVNNALHERVDIDDSLSGTTAITVLFHKGTIYVANVGDSRAIIGEERNGKLVAFPLSSDQTPFRKDERDRCKAAGAVVANMDQMDGIEPMARSGSRARAARTTTRATRRVSGCGTRPCPAAPSRARLATRSASRSACLRAGGARQGPHRE